jgi:hypothetical protein
MSNLDCRIAKGICGKSQAQACEKSALPTSNYSSGLAMASGNRAFGWLIAAGQTNKGRTLDASGSPS